MARCARLALGPLRRSCRCDGVQYGVQTERNLGQLSTTQIRSRPLNPPRYVWIAPAGSRAVAGSNPVSPISGRTIPSTRRARSCTVPETAELGRRRAVATLLRPFLDDNSSV